MEMAIHFIKNNLTRFLLFILVIFIWFINYKSACGFSFCLFKMFTKRQCFACGTLRGVSAFLHLDFKAAFSLNKMNIISIPVLGIVYLNAWKNNRL